MKDLHLLSEEVAGLRRAGEHDSSTRAEAIERTGGPGIDGDLPAVVAVIWPCRSLPILQSNWYRLVADVVTGELVGAVQPVVAGLRLRSRSRRRRSGI